MSDKAGGQILGLLIFGVIGGIAAGSWGVLAGLAIAVIDFVADGLSEIAWAISQNKTKGTD